MRLDYIPNTARKKQVDIVISNSSVRRHQRHARVRKFRPDIAPRQRLQQQSPLPIVIPPAERALPISPTPTKPLSEHNERMEFLGTPFLSLVVSELLMNALSAAEGELSRIRAPW